MDLEIPVGERLISLRPCTSSREKEESLYRRLVAATGVPSRHLAIVGDRGFPSESICWGDEGPSES